MTLRLAGSTSGYTEIDAPAVAGNNTLLLPTGNGTNGQVLTTSGTGALSWSSVTSSKILQVAQAFKSDTFTTTSNTYVDLTGLSVSITPASTNNKVLIFYYVGGATTSNGNSIIFQIVRNSTAIALSDIAGNRLQATNRFHTPDANHTFYTSACYLDSPALASSITYKVQVCVQTANTAVINRTGTDGNTTNPSDSRSTSGIVVMEVAP